MIAGLADLAGSQVDATSNLRSYANRRYSILPNQLDEEEISERVQEIKIFESQNMEVKPYKIIFIGESQTGKTSILKRFTRNEFSDNEITTIGVDFTILNMKIDNRFVKM